MNNHKKRRMHFKTIRTHRKYVGYWCRKMGIMWQGLVHDLSKYSKQERSIYLYYGGGRSPHEIARQELGFSPSWLYHKNRNKHHWEFWLDNQDGIDFKPVKIPYKYIVEMFCDFVGAGKAYSKDNWTPSSPLSYYDNRCRGQRLMHQQSEQFLVLLLTRLRDLKDPKVFFQWYKINKKLLQKEYLVEEKNYEQPNK